MRVAQDPKSPHRGLGHAGWVATLVTLIAALVVVVVGWIGADPATAHAAPPGMASLTGQVTAPSPFRAARVYMRNTDKKILHMVYTQGGRFRATPLFPGTYEIRVITNGLVSEMQPVTLKAGESRALTVELRPGTARPPVGATPSGDSEADTNLAAGIAEEASYEDIYPPAPGRAVAERTCLVCHGENFLPSRPASRASWESRIGHMMGAALGTQPASSYAQGLLTYRSGELGFSREDRDALLEYMVENFGPRAKPRRVRIAQELPVEESHLGKAMYIEYYLTEDPPNQGVHDPEFLKLKGTFCCGRRVGQDVRFDDAGNVWLTDRGYPHRLVRLDPRTGDQKDFLLPDGARFGVHEVVVDRNGIAWAPEHSGADPSSPKRLLGLNPKTGQWEHKIPLDPDNVIRMPIKWTQSLAIDSKGTVYVGWIMGGALSQVDAATRKVTVFPIPEHNAIPYGLVADRNDNIFIALWNSGHIAKFDTHNHQWTLFTPPTHPGQTRRLSVDMQNNIWWGTYSAGQRQGKLVKLDQATGLITEVTIPRQNTQPYDVETDAEGNIWAADGGGSAAALWRFEPKTQNFTLYPKPQESADTPKIQVTKEGAVWYSPRGSANAPAIGVLFPDMDKISTLGAYYPNGTPGNWFRGAPSRSN
jgi:streptogramin lyase/cytochrome c5